MLRLLGRGCAPASCIEVASLTSSPPLGRGCASMCGGIGVEIGVHWYRGCVLVSRLRSVCGFDVWVTKLGFGGFQHLGLMDF